MPRTIEQVNAWMRDPGNELRHQGDGWHNRCEQFTNNAGGFGQTFGTALATAIASGPLNPDVSEIRDGAVGYWRGVWLWDKNLGMFVECGHTAFWFRGRWLMASDACTEPMGGGTGTITHSEYARLRPSARWWGWTMRHGTETLSASSTASTASTGTTRPLPIVPATRKKPTMSTGYYTDRADKTREFALAGDGVGAAAWIPVDDNTAQAMAKVHGPFVSLSPTSFDNFKARYLSVLPAGNVTVNSSSDSAVLAKILAAITALPAATLAEESRRLSQ